MIEFDRMLGYLPTTFDTAPHATLAIRITQPGVTLEVRNTKLWVNGSPIPLQGSLNDVVAAIATLGVSVVLTRPDLKDLTQGARLLLDQGLFTTDEPGGDLYIFENLLWVLLRPLGFALEARSEGISSALAQLNLLTSEGEWADTWGRFLGIRRHAGEADATYTARMKHEIIRGRENNLALAQILADDFGIEDVVIEDLLPLVLIWNETRWQSYVAGQIYNSGAFRVIYADPGGVDSRQVVAAVAKHKSAGTRFVMRVEQHHVGTLRTMVVGHVVSGNAKVWDGRFAGLLLRARVQVGSAPAIDVLVSKRRFWRPGVTGMPGSIVGA